MDHSQPFLANVEKLEEDHHLFSNAIKFDLQQLKNESGDINDLTTLLELVLNDSLNETDLEKPLLITNWSQNNNEECEKHSSWKKFMTYCTKFSGTGVNKLPREPFTETLLTVFGAFVSMLIFGLIDHFWLRPRGYVFILAPFAAMATVMFYFHSYKHPVSQPRNAIFANIVGAIIGVAVRKCVGEEMLWLGCPLALGLCMAIMCLTNTVNPPAGAMTMTVFYGGRLVANQQFMFVLIPAATGTVLFVLLVLLINNLSPKRKYPVYWI